MNETQRASSALRALDPGCDRAQWVLIAMAGKAAGLPLDEFVEWSRPASNFTGERDCRQLWDSIDDGPVQAGTLYRMAIDAGWHDADRGGIGGSKAGHQVRLHRLPPGRHGAPNSAVRECLTFWERCQPATDGHPYIVAKRGSGDGLRVVPADDGLAIAGQGVAGWLVVPVMSLAGTLCTLQLIPPPGVGRKLNLPGASFDDGLFIVGHVAATGRLFVVEGIGQAWSCWRASGCAAVVCFGSGRMARVAAVLHASYPQHRICVVADRGMETKAADAARTVDGDWVQLPDDKPQNYDVNDYEAEHGLDALVALLNAPRTPEKRYRVLAAPDLMNAPPLRWLVRSVLPANGLACMFGASGSGKSFLVLDLSASVASGAPWFGHRSTQGEVVYVALEGEAGFRQRVTAWQKHRGEDVPQSLRFVMQPFDLRRADDVADLVDAVRASGGAGGLLVLDTLNRASGGADENSSKDMGELIDSAKELQARLGGTVLLIHHSGKDQSKGLRGHSSLHGALDAAIEVTRNDDRREWRVHKSKDDRDGDAHAFRLEVVEIGTDEYGDPLTSCVVVLDDGAGQVRRVPPPKAGNQKVVMDGLGEMLREACGTRPKDAPERLPFGRPAVPLQNAMERLAGRLVCDPKRRTERMQQALTGLQNRGAVVIDGGYVWVS